MSTQEAKGRLERLQGVLDLLDLRTLICGSRHGQGIARAIQQTSEEGCSWNTARSILRCRGSKNETGSQPSGELFANSRKARFYSLTSSARRQLVRETTKWKRLAAAIGPILGLEAGGS
jgi:PadR family transcriptional regulator PadR